MSFLKKNREKLFPGLNDFNREYKEYKYKKFSQHDNIMDFFWFSPYVYIYFQFIPPIFMTVLVVFVSFLNIIPLFLKILIIMAYVWYAWKKMFELAAKRQMMLRTNFYELYIKN